MFELSSYSYFSSSSIYNRNSFNWQLEETPHLLFKRQYRAIIGGKMKLKTDPRIFLFFQYSRLEAVFHHSWRTADIKENIKILKDL